MNRRAAAAVAAAVGLMAGPWGCSAPSQPDGEVLATYRGGTVTRAELDARITALPVPDRRPEDGDFAAWREGLLRDLAVEKILYDEAVAAGTRDSPEVERHLQEIEREAIAAVFVERHGESAQEPTDADLRRLFEESRGELERPARREVFHIFRRVEAGADASAELALLEQLRQRVLAGESFQALASEFSQSESRNRRGLMGWYGRGQLDPRLEKILFDLPPRTPSEPLRTSTGVHMFWIESASERIAYSFEQARPLLLHRAWAEERLDAARRLVTGEPPAGSFVPAATELEEILRSGDPQALVLRIGGYEVRLRDLWRRAAETGGQGGRGPEGPALVVEALELRELLYLQARDELAEDPEVRRRVDGLTRAAVVNEYARRSLLDEIKADRPRLEEYFERNRQRYSEPLRLHLSLLSVPFGDAPDRRMQALEAAGPDLDGGGTTLEQLARRWQGSVEDLGWQRLSEIQRRSPAMAQLAVRLTAGSHSPPYRGGHDDLEILRLEERRDPVPLPLSRVEDQVAESYLANRGQELFRAFAEKLLAERGFRLEAAVWELDKSHPEG